MKQIEKTIKALGLSIKDVTKGLNGYPTPFIGQFVHGFASFEEAQRIASELGGIVVEARWKDGWNVVELHGEAFELIKASDINRGGNYTIVSSIDEIIAESNVLISQLDEEDDIEAITAIQFGTEDLVNECKQVDWLTEVVVLCEGEYVETVKRQAMFASFDSNNRAIGVFLKSDF